ncbi:16S rRNA (cytidine(1402)-2'-O)-methyltransferase [Futiania mangrovi]|uniref:16S rRNA (cytidine(1402)-2'-O)-methyltransferase n=1 Tax=Futiania mangrovi TaxID=2959716 RepID=UPI0038B407D9
MEPLGVRQTKPEAPETQPEAEAARAPGAPVWRRTPLDAGLHVVATPIGNLRDVSLRALDTLASAAVIACEDTRMTGRLLAAYGIRTTLTPYHDHNAAAARPKLLARLAAGEAVALVSDAGTPLVSDPGYKLVRAVLEAGHRVIPVPGASALLAGLVSAGLPTDRVTFAGFLPAKAGARERALRDLAGHQATLVFYESGPRLAASLAAMAGVLGDREAAVARELTKLHEEVRRGTLADLAAHYAEAGPPKGEIVVVVGPPGETEAPDAESLDARLAELVPNLGVKGAARQIAAETGMPMRDLYARALALPR